MIYKTKGITVFILLLLLLLQFPVFKTGILYSQEAQVKQEEKQVQVDLLEREQVYDQPITDGPYIFRQDNKVLVYFIHDNQLLHQLFEVRKAEYTVNIRAVNQTYIIPTAPPKVEPAFYDKVSEIFVVSDIHGQFERFKNLLINNKIVDKNMEWRFKKGHLVVLGDVFDRGPLVTESLWTIHQLEQQARKRGGKVHYLLGNHEIMVLHGDVRYVNAKYAYAAENILKIEVPVLYGPMSVMGKWLRTKNTIIRINDLLFVHGGIHPEIMARNLDINSINTLVRDNLDTPMETIKQDDLLALLFYKNGPFWFRGYFPSDEDFTQLETPVVQQTLDYFKVKHIIVGHTTLQEVTPLFDKRVIATDSDIKSGDKGEALYWKKGKFFHATVEGKKILIN